jgi:hypothetical protein
VPSTLGIVASGQNFPLSLAPVVWLDAADTSTITASGSPSKVSQWNDKSGNGRNVAQATGANQPTTGATTQNSLNVLDFDGGDVLTRASVTINQPYTVAQVWRYTSGVGAGITTVTLSLAELGAYAGYIGDSQYRMFNGTVVNSAAIADTSVHQITTVHNTTASSVRLDGTLVAGPANAGSTNGSRINVGAANSTGTAAFTGFIAEILVFPVALSASELTDVETYLKNKWGTP